MHPTLTRVLVAALCALAGFIVAAVREAPMKRRGRPVAAVVLPTAIAMVTFALLVGNVTIDKVVEQKVADQATPVAKAAATKEVKAQVQEKIDASVDDEVTRRLLPDTVITPPTLPADEAPIEPVPTTTTQLGPYDLTTTTTTVEVPPVTTTTIEVPTTVTVPDTIPLP